MKIISKYKDFYDFLYTDNDPDVTYIRDPKMYMYYNIEPTPFIGYSNAYITSISSGKYRYILGKDIVLFGIYPYVYAQYIMGIYDMQKKEQLKVIIPVKIELFNKSNEEILDYFLKTSKLNINKNEVYCKLTNITKYSFIGTKTIEPIIKNTEVFEFIKAPVFISFTENQNNFIKYLDFLPESFSELKKTAIKRHVKIGRYSGTNIIISNISFNFLNDYGINLLKYWNSEFYNNRDVYNDIESFILSHKEMPISEPTNDIKILNAGFDLKTSFRNVK